MVMFLGNVLVYTVMVVVVLHITGYWRIFEAQEFKSVPTECKCKNKSAQQFVPPASDKLKDVGP